MDYKKIFAELVRLAVEKDYKPDEIRDDFDGFEKAFRDFFGESYRILCPRNCIQFENLVIRGSEIKQAEEVLTRHGIPEVDAPVVLQKIADVLLGNNLYVG